MTLRPTVALLLALGGCSDNTGPESCGQGVPFPDAVCLDMSQAGGLSAQAALIETEVERGLVAIRRHLAVSDLVVRIVADPAGVIPEVGMGGFNPAPDEVRIFADPADPGVEKAIRDHLVATLAHEVHHAMRRRSVGYGATLFEAAVTEGLADHFSLEVEDYPVPPWSVALTGEELDPWLAEVLADGGGAYDHPAWFLGSDPSIPRWAGYAVGFELVRDFLARNPGARASTLVDRPAVDFRPAG